MLEFAQIFTDGAVLQKGREIKIWGTSDAPLGSIVKVMLDDSSIDTKIGENGAFSCKLPKFGYGGPYVLSAECGTDFTRCEDVYIGEVYVAGGQSNMEYRLASDKYINEEKQFLDNPMIRLFNTPRISHTDFIADAYKTVWRKSSVEVVNDFPAAGYYFAKRLYENLNVAIGIIDCSWGGTSASAWLSEEYLSKNNETKVYLDDFENLKKSKTEEQLKNEQIEYEKSVKDWNTRWQEGNNKGLTGKALEDFTGVYPWLNPYAYFREYAPCMLYKTMFSRVVKGYTVAGALFYQGESDAWRHNVYEKLFGAMIDNWRSDLEYWDMPFYFVQLTAYGCDGHPDGEDWPKLRDAQYRTSQHKLNVYQAVIIDVGDELDIHPKDKKTVGERLGGLALRYTYNKPVQCDFPEPTGRICRKGAELVIEFKNAYGGLEVRGNKKGFEVAGADGKYYPAEVRVFGDKAIIKASDVYEIKSVKYAYKNNPDFCLYNSEELPANPFRIDL